MNLGGWELLLVLLIILVLFGAGRVTRVGSELGGAIREFRKGLQGDTEEQEKEEKSDSEAPSQSDK